MSAASTCCSSRSAYVAQLRRAFLLRVHPDRFASKKVRAEQAAFVQAFHQRIAQEDFLAWQSHSELDFHRSVETKLRNDYVCTVQKRDGSFLRKKISLSDSVPDLLINISSVLHESGATSVPVAPKDESDPHQVQSPFSASTYGVKRPQFTSHPLGSPWKQTSEKRETLKEFLTRIDLGLIATRQQSRWDAKTVASVARRTFGFVMIDATRTRWASESVASLLRRFVAIANESYSFQVHSFSPLRLVWCPTAREATLSSDDEHGGQHIDLFEGNLFLNPSAASVQWAETLRTVTDETIRKVRWLQQKRSQRSKLIQDFFGGTISIRKGFTCSSRGYFECLERLSAQLEASLVRWNIPENADNVSIVPSCGFSLVVESDFVARRPCVTEKGDLQVNSSLSPDCILESIFELRMQAVERSATEKAISILCNELVVKAQQVLGLQRVYAYSKTVTRQEYSDCLSRLLAKSDDMGILLSGHSLGVASSGHSFHIADDGSIVIPHNFVW